MRYEIILSCTEVSDIEVDALRFVGESKRDFVNEKPNSCELKTLWIWKAFRYLQSNRVQTSFGLNSLWIWQKPSQDSFSGRGYCGAAISRRANRKIKQLKVIIVGPLKQQFQIVYLNRNWALLILTEVVLLAFGNKSHWRAQINRRNIRAIF